MMDYARHIFDNMLSLDVVSWTTIISAYVQAERGNEAVEVFKSTLHEHELPNSKIFTILLSVCGSVSASKLGQQFHTVAIKYGMDSELIVTNALMSMYFKCGSADSHKVFNGGTGHILVEYFYYRLSAAWPWKTSHQYV
jgi:pentatricopeptide repeat protein